VTYHLPAKLNERMSHISTIADLVVEFIELKGISYLLYLSIIQRAFAFTYFSGDLRSEWIHSTLSVQKAAIRDRKFGQQICTNVDLSLKSLRLTNWRRDSPGSLRLWPRYLVLLSQRHCAILVPFLGTLLDVWRSCWDRKVNRRFNEPII